MIWPTVGKLNSLDVTFGWIRNSLEIGVLGLTENLRPQIEANPDLEIIGKTMDWPFDQNGDLPRHLPIPAGAAAAHWRARYSKKFVEPSCRRNQR